MDSLAEDTAKTKTNYAGCHVDNADLFLLDAVDRYPRTVDGVVWVR